MMMIAVSPLRAAQGLDPSPVLTGEQPLPRLLQEYPLQRLPQRWPPHEGRPAPVLLGSRPRKSRAEVDRLVVVVAVVVVAAVME